MLSNIMIGAPEFQVSHLFFPPLCILFDYFVCVHMCHRICVCPPALDLSSEPKETYPPCHLMFLVSLVTAMAIGLAQSLGKPLEKY